MQTFFTTTTNRTLTIHRQICLDSALKYQKLQFQPLGLDLNSKVSMKQLQMINF
jgi:hypothetical protein